MKQLALFVFLAFSCSLYAQNPSLHIVTTGDVHGAWFHKPYVDGSGTRTSLMSVKHYLDSLRTEVGSDNVLLLDAGDCLQGDNASYYYNYVAVDGKHLFSRICKYMGYDALVVGNHDIETGHSVYDKVNSELSAAGIPWLSGSYLKTDDGMPYFPMYRVFDKAGKRVMVVGFGNANIKSWLSEELWEGMGFESLVPFAQYCVDYLREVEKPDAVVVVMHSGTGEGDGSALENQGLDMLNGMRGVDVLVCGHDHRPFVKEKDGAVLLNAGSKAGTIGHATISFDGGKKVSGETVRLDKNAIDVRMERRFRRQFEAVRKFTNRKVGVLAMDMKTRDAYRGMSDYINLVHTVQLGVPEAELSFAAPLTYNGTVKGGTLIYNDMFTIYPYENQLFVVRMKGSEIKSYLEYSYDNWIQTPGEHLLRIEKGADARTGADRWSFTGRTYNFDSAAGLVYTVDINKAAGERVNISSLADGKPFSPDSWYNVAMTSYRANGGGMLMPAGAGVNSDEVEGRIVARYPEIRELVYQFIEAHKELNPELIGNRSVLGSWKFVPESEAAPLLDADMDLVF